MPDTEPKVEPEVSLVEFLRQRIEDYRILLIMLEHDLERVRSGTATYDDF